MLLKAAQKAKKELSDEGEEIDIEISDIFFAAVNVTITSPRSEVFS